MKAGHTSKRTSLLIRISTHDVLSGSSARCGLSDFLIVSRPVEEIDRISGAMPIIGRLHVVTDRSRRISRMFIARHMETHSSDTSLTDAMSNVFARSEIYQLPIFIENVSMLILITLSQSLRKWLTASFRIVSFLTGKVKLGE